MSDLSGMPLIDPATALAVHMAVTDIPGLGGDAPLTPNQLAVYCQTLGFTKIAFEFHGGSDEGGADSITVTRADGTELDVPDWNATAPLDEITAVIDAMLYDNWYGFDGEPDVDGHGTFDPATATWTLEGTESYSEGKDFTYTYEADETPDNTNA